MEINVKNLGACGNGATDDTAKIQQALDYWQTGGGQNRSGSIYFPEGIYRITSPLVFHGTGGYGLRMHGEIGGTMFPAGSVIRWDGEENATMFDGAGLCSGSFEHLEFDAQDLAKHCVSVHWDNSRSPHYASGNVFRRCTFSNAIGEDSALVLYGAEGDTHQADEGTFYDCYFLGSSIHVGETESLFRTGGSANVCNFRFYNCQGVRAKYGYKLGSNGAVLISGGGMGDISNAYVKSAASTIMMQGIRCESNLTGARLVYADAGIVTVQQCEAWMNAPTDHIAVVCGGLLTLIGNYFFDIASGNPGMLIQSGNPGPDGQSSIVSMNNQYLGWNPGELLFVDGSGNDLMVGPVPASNPQRVFSFGDMGGPSGTPKRVPSVNGTAPVSPVLGFVNGSTGTGISREFSGEVRRAHSSIKIDYRALQDQGGNKILLVDSLLPGTRLKRVIVKTRIPMVGCQCDVMLGWGSFNSSIIASFDGTVTSAPHESGALDVVDWGNQLDLYVTFTNGGTAPFSQLTAGEVEIILDKEFF